MDTRLSSGGERFDFATRRGWGLSEGRRTDSKSGKPDSSPGRPATGMCFGSGLALQAELEGSTPYVSTTAASARRSCSPLVKVRIRFDSGMRLFASMAEWLGTGLPNQLRAFDPRYSHLAPEM